MKEIYKSLLTIVIVFGLMIAFLAASFPNIIKQSNDQINAFKLEAQVHLGTSNFTILLSDGYMIAMEPNGTRYPTQATEDQFYQNQLITQLEVVGVGALIIAIVVFVLGTRAYRKETKVALNDCE